MKSSKDLDEQISDILWSALSQATTHAINCTRHNISYEDFTTAIHKETRKEVLRLIDQHAHSVAHSEATAVLEELEQQSRVASMCTSDTYVVKSRVIHSIKERYQ